MMRISDLNFLNMQGILVEKVYIAHAIFRQFSDIENRAWSQQASILCQLVTGESQRTWISCLRESMQHYFQ